MTGPRLVKPAVIEASAALQKELDRPPLALYDIVAALEAVDAHLEESGGELTPEIEAALNDLDGRFDDKVHNICLFRRNELARAEVLEAEIERLDKRAKLARRKADSLKTFLLGAFVHAGKDRLKLAHFTVYTAKNPTSIRWTRDLDALPEQYRRVKVEPDIAKVKEEHKQGAALPNGFVTVEGALRLEIR